MTIPARKTIFVAIAAACLGLVAPAVSTGAVENGPHPALHRVQTLDLRQLASPAGTFTIQIPAGWGFRPGGDSDASISVAPAGQQFPNAFVLGMIPITGLTTDLTVPNPLGDTDGWLRSYFGEMASPPNAAQAVQAYASAVNRGLLAGAGVTNTQIVELRSLAANAAQVESRYQLKGQTIEEWTYVHLAYSPNPSYSALLGRTAYDTFAFVAGCSAPAGTLGQFAEACARILRSFHPGAGWLHDQLDRYYENQDAQIGMTQTSLDQISQMRARTAAQLQESTQRVGALWRNSLGGTTDLVDPTSGETYNVPDQYKYYCLSPAQKVLGTDEPSLLRTTDCQTSLRRQSA